MPQLAMRKSILIAALPWAISAAGAKPNVSLTPPVDSAIMFGTDGPRAVTPDHPLFGHVVVDPIADMPPKIGKFLVPITRADELNHALRDALSRARMLADARGASPLFRLVTRWRSLDAPQRIGISAYGAATIDYELRRIDSGATIFHREIVTRTDARGGDAADRLQGVARFALQLNLASAVACLDKAAYGQAPADCALKTNAYYNARSVPIITLAPSFR